MRSCWQFETGGNKTEKLESFRSLPAEVRCLVCRIYSNAERASEGSTRSGRVPLSRWLSLTQSAVRVSGFVLPLQYFSSDTRRSAMQENGWDESMRKDLQDDSICASGSGLFDYLRRFHRPWGRWSIVTSLARS